MTLRTSFRRAFLAARANILPGLLLQSLMVVFLAAYVTHEGTRRVLNEVAHVKEESGFLFAFVCYVISAALLPEILKIFFFQGGTATRRNLTNFLTGAPAWGCIGMLVDAFYRFQSLCFGTGDGWLTVFLKMSVDQFIFSPFLCTPITIAYFLWRDAGYRPGILRIVFHWSFFTERVLPVQVAGWCIWIPGVSLVYFMPSPLQIPVAVLIQSFWVLIFTMIDRPPAEKAARA